MRQNRRSIRLSNYDYTQTGAYFITICTYQRECLFGNIIDDIMVLNDVGQLVADEWIKTALLRKQIELDAFVVMPNHFHGIVWIIDIDANENGRGTARRAPTHGQFANTTEKFGKPIVGSIPTIIRAFKSAATQKINLHRQTQGSPIWQRNYWEHVIRNESELRAIREYIQNNPAQWELDQLYEP